MGLDVVSKPLYAHLIKYLEFWKSNFLDIVEYTVGNVEITHHESFLLKLHYFNCQYQGKSKTRGHWIAQEYMINYFQIRPVLLNKKNFKVFPLHVMLKK